MEGIQTALGNSSPGLTLFMIVVGLAVALVLLFWIFRKIAGTGGIGSRRNKQPRLAVLDAAHVDGKRRLVLVRRDDVEHLVMIGGSSDVLIESNINPSSIPVPQKEHRSRRKSTRENKTGTSDQQESHDGGSPSQGAAAAAAVGATAAVIASELAEPAETVHGEETAFVEDVHHSTGTDLHENEPDNVSEFVAPDEIGTAPEIEQTPPPSSVLEVELENALQTEDQIEDPFAELETELASADLEIENFEVDLTQRIDAPEHALEEPDHVAEELPQVDLAPPQVDAPEPDIEEVSPVDQPVSEVEGEPVAKPEQKQALSKNKNVEDEMQRLLDELANS